MNFEEVISFESLFRAHIRARKGKRWKNEVVQFELGLSSNLCRLHYDLKYGRYNVGPYASFRVYDPKEREIEAISYRDRIIQHSLCDNYLMPLLERRLIYDNVACRKGKGTAFAFSRLRRFCNSYYRKYGNKGYFVKIDVRKYFLSIDHEKLKEKLSRIVDDKRILDLLFLIIDSYHRESGIGLPLGNQTSQCFALLYLDGFDRFFKEAMQVKRYIRYMDDIVMMARNKVEADELLCLARRLLKGEHLAINEKSQAYAIAKGVPFLGFRCSMKSNGRIEQTVLSKSKIHISRRLREICCFNMKDKLQIIASYRGHLCKENAFHYFRFIKRKIINSPILMDSK